MPEGRSEVGGGLADGLFGSKIFVPVLSKAGLAGFAELQEDSPCDNVLLEHFLALEMQKRGLLHAIFPVFVGQQFASGGHDNFFKGRSLPSFKGNDIIVESVMENAKVHLERKLGRSSGGQFEVVDRSPRALLNEIRGHQGGFIEGNREVALDNVALKILEMVQDVSAGRLSADARDGIANSDKPDPVSCQTRRNRRYSAATVRVGSLGCGGFRRAGGRTRRSSISIRRLRRMGLTTTPEAAAMEWLGRPTSRVGTEASRISLVPASRMRLLVRRSAL